MGNDLCHNLDFMKEFVIRRTKFKDFKIYSTFIDSMQNKIDIMPILLSLVVTDKKNFVDIHFKPINGVFKNWRVLNSV